MKQKVLRMFVFTVRSSIEVGEHSPVVQNRRGNRDSGRRMLILPSRTTCRNRIARTPRTLRTRVRQNRIVTRFPTLMIRERFTAPGAET